MTITRNELDEAARGLGIDSVALVSLRSLDDSSEVKVRSGGLRRLNMAQEARALLPSAASVIVLASAYYDDRSADLSAPGDPHGVLGRGLWKDHTAALRRKAESLIHYLKEMEVRSVLAEDLPLRDLGHRAGLGTPGKNSLLQSFDHGSWVLLTALVTEADLPSGEMEECRCGSCQACLRLCPTKAITAPFTVDAGRCLDQLLSSTDHIPLELREAIGARVLSCDVCQEVCPRNKFVLPCTSEAKDRFAALTRSPPLGRLALMSEEQYHEEFDWMGCRTPDLYLLRRNAIIALGNSGEQVGTLVLAQELLDPDPRLRGYASWALAKIGEVTSAQCIKNALRKEEDDFAQEEMRMALLRLSEKENSTECGG